MNGLYQLQQNFELSGHLHQIQAVAELVKIQNPKSVFFQLGLKYTGLRTFLESKKFLLNSCPDFWNLKFDRLKSGIPDFSGQEFDKNFFDSKYVLTVYFKPCKKIRILHYYGVTPLSLANAHLSYKGMHKC